MYIKNLAQLKRALQPGRTFTYIRHHKEDRMGMKMVVSVRQADSIYVQVAGQPDHFISQSNGGRGSWIQYSKAPFYRFGETVALYSSPDHSDDALVYEFKVNEEAAVC